MQLENILYAGVQIVHNFGAAAVTGLPIAVLWFGLEQRAALRAMAWLTLAAWLAQAASGAGFGAVSYFVVGELPQIHHLALAALITKIGCAFAAIALLGVALFGAAAPSRKRWASLALLGSVALICAAILRWLS